MFERTHRYAGLHVYHLFLAIDGAKYVKHAHSSSK